MKNDRAEKIDRAIRLSWDSLVSHLPYTYNKIDGWAKKRGETHKFHQKCVRDYAEVIKILSELY